VSAEGRLEQPLTYWNAMGELAAIGLVLCARLVGDASRQTWMRILAVAAAAPVGMALYISFSRGAVFAAVAGLLALLLLAATFEQLRGIGQTLGVGILSAASAAPFHPVTSLAGPLATRERDGAITLVLLVVIMVASAEVQRRLMRRERPRRLTLPRAAPTIAVAAICAGLGLAIVVGAKEQSHAPLSAGATRYVTLQSNRYAYWRVAMTAFEDQPLRGVGAGGWAVYWLRDRPFKEFAHDAHSLPIQTLAELGVIGLALLLLFVAGVGLAARDALRAGLPTAAGATAAFVTWLAHQPLDWDWQMPALTLIGIICAGALIADVSP
jgi:hypothetical protein